MSHRRVADFILRAGVAFAFIYPPLSALADPNSWIGYFPSFVKGYVPDLVLLHVFGVVEIIIALWILSGWRIFFPSLIATLMLLVIVVFNSFDFEILFRDVSIATMVFSLAMVSWGDEFRRSGIAGSTAA